jgi:hypothetical protein
MLSVGGGEPRDAWVEDAHERAMQLIWKTFQEHVSDATQLVMIGYSLPGTDASSVSVLRNFAPDPDAQKRKRVLIVDKNGGSIKQVASIRRQAHFIMRCGRQRGSPQMTVPYFVPTLDQRP